MTAKLVPACARYRREWLRFDLIAGVVIWSVVTPQAVAYAQIAGLPPEAGLMAAPGAMIAYGLIGTSRAALLDLGAHGVDVVGDIPDALPDLAIPTSGLETWSTSSRPRSGC